jgi:type IV fimbrial biogenesis protein FimT
MKKGNPSCFGGGARGASGFTLIEVLVTVIILGTLLTIAIPGFLKWLPNYRLNGAARDFYSNIQLAKSLAIRQRANTFISFEDDTYTVTRNGTSFKTTNLKDYGSGVSFASGSTTANIEFTPMGMTTNSADVSVTITNSRGTTRTIKVYPSGAVSLQK